MFGFFVAVRVNHDKANATFIAVLQNKGGAIINLGTLDLFGGSLFEGNVAASSGDGGSGGGIYNGGEGCLS